MTGLELKESRCRAGWTQARLARRLGATQAYLSLMERGKRRVTDRVARQVSSLFDLPPTLLPMAETRKLAPAALDAELEQGLARLGYPGLAYRRTPGPRRNPGALLLMALGADDLDPRLAEALPWLLLEFAGVCEDVLVARAKNMDLQNRLGFTVSLARRVAERNPLFRDRGQALEALERVLERSRLVREDTYGRAERTERMRGWLRHNRSAEAEHWNLLTDLDPEHLPYAQANPGALAELPSRR